MRADGWRTQATAPTRPRPVAVYRLVSRLVQNQQEHWSLPRGPPIPPPVPQGWVLGPLLFVHPPWGQSFFFGYPSTPMTPSCSSPKLSLGPCGCSTTTTTGFALVVSSPPITLVSCSVSPVPPSHPPHGRRGPLGACPRPSTRLPSPPSYLQAFGDALEGEAVAPEGQHRAVGTGVLEELRFSGLGHVVAWGQRGDGWGW